MSIPDRNSGHGHVYPRPDGVRARCGGPRMCRQCQADAARKDAEAVELAELEARVALARALHRPTT